MSFRRYSPEDIDVLARTIYGEAHGEPWLCRLAVGWVIKNRLLIGGRWAESDNAKIENDSLTAVCMLPHAFRCWTGRTADLIAGAPPEEIMQAGCRAAAEAVLFGGTEDPTRGALRYKPYGQSANWHSGEMPVALIGSLEFFHIGFS